MNRPRRMCECYIVRKVLMCTWSRVRLRWRSASPACFRTPTALCIRPPFRWGKHRFIPWFRLSRRMSTTPVLYCTTLETTSLCIVLVEVEPGSNSRIGCFWGIDPLSGLVEGVVSSLTVVQHRRVRSTHVRGSSESTHRAREYVLDYEIHSGYRYCTRSRLCTTISIALQREGPVLP